MKHILFITLAAALVAGAALAQEAPASDTSEGFEDAKTSSDTAAGASGDTSDASSGSFDDWSDWGTPSGASSGGFDDWGADGGWDSGTPQITFGVTGELGVRLYPVYKEDGDTVNNAPDFSTWLPDMPLFATPKAKINLGYSGSMFDAALSVRLDPDTIENHPVDILDEFTMTGYFGNLRIEAGKMRVVWGKGDMLHVIDNFNADDYTDFVIPNYIDRRVSTPMLRALYSFGSSNIRLEGVWTPFMEADRFATSGQWTPKIYTDLVKNVTETLGLNDLLSSQDSLLSDDRIKKVLSILQEKASDLLSDAVYPDTHRLRYTQAGLRLTGTAGLVDWGASYYFGRYKQPSVNYSAQAASEDSSGDQSDGLGNLSKLPTLDYDVRHTFGLEAATVLWRFNLRGELAYNLTNDIAGSDPWVHNNSLAWLAGFDIDLPLNNINVNVQETGTFTLGGGKIEAAEGLYKTRDVDYKGGKYTNNRLVVNISDSYFNAKLSAALTFMWGIERADIILMPSLTYSPTSFLSFALSGLWLHVTDEYSDFYGWGDNSFVNFTVRCQF